MLASGLAKKAYYITADNAIPRSLPHTHAAQ